MSDESQARPIPPEIQAELDRIRQEREQEVAAAAASAQAEVDRNAKLDAAKQICIDKCGPISAVLAQTTDERERAVLIELEQRTHADHGADLEAAYLEHAGQRDGDSNPAAPGETELVSHAAMVSEVE